MAAKKKAVSESAGAAEKASAVAPESAPESDGARDVMIECVALLDPQGKGHIPSGDPGVYQEVLEKLSACLEA